MVREVPIREQSIRLGQLLKLAGIVDSGSEVKSLLAHAPALVNGERESRRGRQLRPGDRVRIGAQELLVIAAAPRATDRADPTDRAGAVGGADPPAPADAT